MAKLINFEEIKNYNEDVYSYLCDIGLKEMPLGKHTFEDNVYFNVEEYTTFDSRVRRYEVHKHYIDIQIVVSGKEYIKVGTKNNSIVSKYSQERDIAFYRSVENEKEYLIDGTKCLVLEPSDVHMPCVKVEKPECVKKIVIKLPVKVEKNITAMVMDVDGTLSDGKIVTSNEGELFKAFNAKDGYGIKFARDNGIEPVILTGRESKIVLNRSKELGITKIYQGVDDKVEKISEIFEDLSNIAYIGDDLNDYDCMLKIKNAGGIVGCPLDANEKVIELADFVAAHNGGSGAIRDFVNFIGRVKC